MGYPGHTHRSCILCDASPPPPPGVFMLAAIMRGFFIIHIMIDVPLVVVFMLQSHMIVLCQEHRAAKHCGPQTKMLSVALCCLLAEKHPLKSLYPRLGRGLDICRSLQDNSEMLFSRIDMVCRLVPVVLYTYTNSIELLVPRLYSLCHKHQ